MFAWHARSSRLAPWRGVVSNVVMTALELKIPPLILLALLGAAMFGLTWLLPGLGFALAHTAIIAGLLVLIGGSVAIAGVVAFRRHQTTVNPMSPESASAIVCDGVYARSRNPMYLGLALILAGIAIYVSNLAALLMVPVFVIYMNRFQIVPEERALLKGFGDLYADYMARVRRWI